MHVDKQRQSIGQLGIPVGTESDKVPITGLYVDFLNGKAFLWCYGEAVSGQVNGAVTRRKVVRELSFAELVDGPRLVSLATYIGPFGVSLAQMSVFSHGAVVI